MWSRKILLRLTVAPDGNAICSKTVELEHRAQLPLSIDGPIKFDFPRRCKNFQVNAVDNQLCPTILDEKRHPFHTEILLACVHQIQPNTTLRFQLTYEWPLFYKNDVCDEIVLSYDTETDLTLRIDVPDDRFTEHHLLVLNNEAALQLDKDYFLVQGGGLFIPAKVAPARPQIIRIIADVRQIRLDVVEHIATTKKGTIGPQFAIVIILHMLRDFLQFLNWLHLLGVDRSDIFVIGIPYSTKDNVFFHLLHRGYNVYKVEKEDYPTFLVKVSKILQGALHHCQQTSKKLILIEDGGYAVPLLHDRQAGLSDYIQFCQGAVEQTRNGIWADKEIANGVGLDFPVINVADSEIKLRRESPLIGQAVVTNLRNLLMEVGDDIEKKDIGLVGYGAVGQEVAKALLGHEAKVTVYDVDNKRLENAKPPVLVAKDTTELVQDKNIIIGCTGREWIHLPELLNITKPIYFVNASSKRREIDYTEFNKFVRGPSRMRKFGSEYVLKVGRKVPIRLIADGFPINFFGESVPDKLIQFIPALLLWSASYVATAKLPTQLVPLPESVQREVDELMELYGN